MTDTEHHYRRQLRAAERRLPRQVESALAEGRRRALAQGAGGDRFRLSLAAGGLVLASVLALVTVSPLLVNRDAPSPAIAVDESPQDEDLDFYYWLAETRPALEG